MAPFASVARFGRFGRFARLAACAELALLCVINTPVYGDEVESLAQSQTSPFVQWASDIQWDAFVSQNMIYTSDNNFLASSDDTVSFDNWEAGFLFNASVANEIRFSGQLLGRKVSESSDEDFRVGYAFLTLPLYQQADTTLGARLGRIRSSFGFYNETRDLPHSRTSVAMPQSIYFDKTRNSFYSADGVELYAFHDFSDYRLSYQFFVSRPVADEDEARETLQPVRKLEGDHAILAKVGFGKEFDGPRFAITYYRPQYSFDVSPAILVSDGKLYSESIVTSFEYNQYQWSFTTEYLRLKNKVIGVKPGGMATAWFEDPGYAETYYAQFVWRFNEHWESYLRHDNSKGRGERTSLSYAYDTSLGVTFKPDDHWLLRAEAHYIEGTGTLLIRDNTDQRTEYWNAVLAQVAYKW
ncbi:hypothetical protein [Litoribrevibacter albus]|uniref:Uncharacterized protein n=1 Tax=Litoribrevibacter albus TaxID=1473156 RepID=A0AA37S776_9GAMM|nr:hypothetical protein [Litoribrevibacter albus]GLQ30351.1 hypothetical protein GCM10007876_08290 [Litoribrevibacter albus]